MRQERGQREVTGDRATVKSLLSFILAPMVCPHSAFIHIEWFQREGRGWRTARAQIDHTPVFSESLFWMNVLLCLITAAMQQMVGSAFCAISPVCLLLNSLLPSPSPPHPPSPHSSTQWARSQRWRFCPPASSLPTSPTLSLPPRACPHPSPQPPSLTLLTLPSPLSPSSFTA